MVVMHGWDTLISRTEPSHGPIASMLTCLPRFTSHDGIFIRHMRSMVLSEGKGPASIRGPLVNQGRGSPPRPQRSRDRHKDKRLRRPPTLFHPTTTLRQAPITMTARESSKDGSRESRATIASVTTSLNPCAIITNSKVKILPRSIRLMTNHTYLVSRPMLRSLSWGPATVCDDPRALQSLQIVLCFRPRRQRPSPTPWPPWN